MKRIYRCEDCKTVLVIESDSHPVPESVICLCSKEIPKLGL